MNDMASSIKKLSPLSPLTLRTHSLKALRTQLRDRQATRAARRSLVRDLTTYSSEAQLTEMEAILSRYDDADGADGADDIAALRTIVAHARAAA